MATTLTTRLAMVKPTPGTGELVNVATQLNTSLDKIDSVIGATICTSATRPATPFDGQLIRETDTRRMYMWNATQVAWDQILVGGGTFTVEVSIDRPVLGDNILTGRVTGDAFSRLLVENQGNIFWGPGTATQDTKLYRNAANQLATDDDFLINLAGRGLRVKEGTNAKMGASGLTAGTVTVANTSVTATSRIFLTCQVVGGTPGFLRVNSRLAGTSFTITSSSATDTSTVGWFIVEPA